MVSTVQRLNQLLDDNGVLLSEEVLREAASNYAAEVRPINEKLDQASDLIRRGLRSEAIALANGPPSLIDAATALEFPRREEFAEMLDFYGEGAPPPIDQDALAMINDAMVEIQPIEGLLRRQRQLALARAPLAWRLRTLRAIADADPMSVHWQEDIDAYENARHKQLNGDVADAVQQADNKRLEALQSELKDPGWVRKPPGKLLASVSKRLQNLQAADLAAELTQHSDRLNAASQNFDENAGRVAANDYRQVRTQLVKLAGSDAVPTEIDASANSGLAWIDELDAEADRINRRNIAVDGLERVLDDPNATVAAIHTAHQKAAAFDEPLPPVQFNRYRAAVDERETRASRKFRISIAAVAATTLIVVGSLVALQLSRTHAASVKAVSGQLEKLLDGNQLSEASKFIDAVQTQQPKIAAAPKVMEFVTRHAEMTRQEVDRAARFAEELKVVAETHDPSLDPSDLTRLEENAVGDSEIDQANEQRRRFQDFMANQSRSQTQSLAAKLETPRKRLAEMTAVSWQRLSITDLDTLIAELDSLTEAIKKIQRDNSFAASAMRKDAASLVKRAAAVRTRWVAGRGQNQQAKQFANLILAARSPATLRRRLKSFADAVPNHPDTNAYRKSLDSASFWDSAETWNQLLLEIEQAFRKGLAAEPIQKVTQLQDTLKDQVTEPPSKLPAVLRDTLGSVEKRRQTLQDSIKHWRSSLFAQVISVTEKEGAGQRHFVYRNYYDRNRQDFLFDPNSSVKKRSLETVSAPDGSIAKTKLEGDFKVDLEPNATIQWLQTKLTGQETKLLADWDGQMLQILAGLQKRSGLDSQIREVITFQLLQQMSEGSPWAKGKFDKLLAQMPQRQSKWRDWFRPANRDNAVGPRMQSQVYPVLGAAFRSRPNPAMAMKSLKELKLVPVGVVILQAIQTSSKVASPSPSVQWWKPIEDLPNGQLLVVHRNSSDPLKGTWIRVGSVNRGKMQPSKPMLETTAGQLVFWQASTTDESDVAARFNPQSRQGWQANSSSSVFISNNLANINRSPVN